MSIFKNIRLGLLHVAVAITFVLINGILNRVMIHDMQILASVVAVLVVLPYLLSPLQVWIGQYSDTHPIMGYRRTPYIALGLLLCIGGAMGTPYVALLMADNFVLGLLLGVLALVPGALASTWQSWPTSRWPMICPPSSIARELSRSCGS